MTAAANTGKVFPKLVLGHILQFSLADDVGSVPSNEAVIHFEGDEDSEINIRCPGALQLAQLIVTACNAQFARAARTALSQLPTHRTASEGE